MRIAGFAVAAALALAGTADAHIRLKAPVPRGFPGGPWPESQYDYDLVAPLNSELGKTYPCGGKVSGGLPGARDSC